MPSHEIPTPSAGLRPPGVRLRNKSNDIIRAAVVVPAGSELEADEYVAGQLQAQSAAFEVVPDGRSGDEAGSDAGIPPVGSDPVVEEAGGGSARRRGGRRG